MLDLDDASRSAAMTSVFPLAYLALQLCQRDGFQDKVLLRRTVGLLQQALEADPADVRPLESLAYLMLVFGDLPKARDYLSRALQLQPRDPAALKLQRTLQQLEAGIVETADGQQLTMVKRLDEQMRNQASRQRLQVQKKLGQEAFQELAAATSAAQRGPEESPPVPSAPLTRLPEPQGFLAPTPEHARLASLALEQPEAKAWTPVLTSALRQFQNLQRLPMHGKLDAASVAELNRRLARREQRQLAGEQIQDLLAAADAPWPQERLSWLIQDLLDGLLEAPATPPAELTPPAPLRILTQALGPRGQAGIISQGEEVAWLQAYLLEQGYALQVNGQFDLQTLTALRSWQQAERLDASGELHAASRDRINQAFALSHQLAQAARRLPEAVLAFLDQQQTGWSQPRAELLSHWQAWIAHWLQGAPRPPLSWPACELGTSGKARHRGWQVLLLQEALRAQGAEIALSGDYDAATQSAIRQLQRQHKLPINGQYDARTQQICRTLNDAFEEAVR